MRPRFAALPVLLVAALGACTTVVQTRSRAEPAVVVVDSDRDRARLRVPPGHLPPPGECRLWFPDRPPGHQPPPGRCSRIERDAPPGSWVLYRPSRDRKVVHARVIDSRRAGMVVAVRVYDAQRGTYLRVERP